MCTKPINAWQLLPKYTFDKNKPCQPIFRRPADITRYAKLLLPCTKCVSCLKVRSMTLAVQLGMELQTTKGDSLFVTLTYNNENLPPGRTLNKEHPRLFMMRLRKWISKHYPGVKIRYKLIGEYTETTNRPHYHYAIFNLARFKDEILSDMMKADSHDMFESETLTNLWGKGHVVYNLLTEASALYIAQHSDKKINRKVDYSANIIDAETGEIIEPPTLPFIMKDKRGRRILDADGEPQTELLKQRVPEFSTGSTKPGIGTKWYEQFGATDLEDGRVISLDYRQHKIPRHIMNLMERDNPDLHELIKLEAKVFAEENQKTQKELDYQDKFDHANLKYKKKRNTL